MKFLKALGGVLCFVGCVVALAGILATAVPLIDNAQVQRIVESFSMVSTDRFVNALNKAILFCLAHNNWVFAAGAALLLAGGLMRSGADRALFKGDAPRGVETRPAKAEPTRGAASPQPAEAPVSPQDKPVKTLSPYAAAEYGRALTRDANGRVASELAEKYKPRSIIDLPPEPELSTDEPLLDRWRAPAEPEPAPVPGAGAAATPALQRVCLNCGLLYAANASYCPHCGLSLQTTDTVEPQPDFTAPYPANAPVPPTAAPAQQQTEPRPESIAPVQPPVTAIPMPVMPPQPSVPTYPEAYRVPSAPAPVLMGQPTTSTVSQTAAVTPEAWQSTPPRRQPRIVSTVQGMPFAPAAPAEAQSGAEPQPVPATPPNPTAEPYPSKRPRIVSTMGRKREP